MADLEQKRRTVRVLELLTESFEAHRRGDDEAFRRSLDEAVGLDPFAVMGIRGGITIGEVPNPERDWLAWTEYVAVNQEALAAAEAARPARVTGIYPGGATSGDHVRVMVRCSCGALTDLTWKADLPPDTVDCTGCGERLVLPGDLEPLTPKQIRCAEWRRSLRRGTDG